jgi:hypothetical protein
MERQKCTESWAPVEEDSTLCHVFVSTLQLEEPGYLSTFTSLLAGDQSRASISGKTRNLKLFFKALTPGLEPIKIPFRWVPGALSMEVKRSDREAGH